MAQQGTMVRDAVVFLAAAVVCVPFFRRTGLGAILGYLAAGMLIGPWGLGLVQDSHSILSFAELGVVFLLFLIGLELKPSRLWAMRRAVFGLGSIQLGFSTAVLLIFFFGALSFSWQQSALLGVVLSLSSTAMALQLLSERGEIKTESGRDSFAILLFQDLAVIPLLAVLPLLASSGSDTAIDFRAVGLGLAVVVGFIVAGRHVVRPFFRWVVGSSVREVFAAGSLLVVLGVSWVVSVVGISMALGAFLAGMMLSDSEYRHELEANIDSFKGLLLGLFFIAIGMSIDFGLLVSEPITVLLMVTAVVVLKGLVLWFLACRKGYPVAARLRFAVTLSQGGEFAFVVATLAEGLALLGREDASRLNLTVALSMITTPLLLKGVDLLLLRFALEAPTKPRLFEVPDEEPEVIIAGFGRVGQIVGRIVKSQGLNFTALEQDFNQVEVVRRFGNKVYFGDASRLDLLQAARVEEAKYFFICIDDVEASVRTAETVLRHFPKVRVIARARNRSHVFQFMKLGVTHVFRETLSSSMEMAAEALRYEGQSDEQIEAVLARFRAFDEKMLNDQYKVHEDQEALISVSKAAAAQLAQVMRRDEETGQNASLR